LHRSNNIISLIKLTDVIVNSIKNNISENIWDIAENNNSISLDILNRSNEYKELYHIHRAFICFKNDLIFTIYYKLIKTCSKGFKHHEESKILEPLLSINLMNLKI